LGDPADSYNMYTIPLILPYPLPGPNVATFTSGGTGAQTKQTEGLKPADCICESGSNFCGVEVPDYTDSDSCYNSSANCFDQAKTCYDTAPATGNKGCVIWEDKCDGIQSQCATGGSGPPNKGKDLSIVHTTIAIPAAFGPTVIGSSTVSGAAETGGAAETAAATAAAPTSGSSVSEGEEEGSGSSALGTSGTVDAGDGYAAATTMMAVYDTHYYTSVTAAATTVAASESDTDNDVDNSDEASPTTTVASGRGHRRPHHRHHRLHRDE